MRRRCRFVRGLTAGQQLATSIGSVQSVMALCRAKTRFRSDGLATRLARSQDPLDHIKSVEMPFIEPRLGLRLSASKQTLQSASMHVELPRRLGNVLAGCLVYTDDMSISHQLRRREYSVGSVGFSLGTPQHF